MAVMVETERLYLREMTVEDVDALYALYEDEASMRFLDALPESREEEKEILAAYIKYIYGFYGFGMWAVCERETDTMIGRCGLQMTEADDEVYAEIGYMTGKAYRGQGYALEAVHGVLEYAWDELELAQVAAFIQPENTISEKLACKAGFIYVKEMLRENQSYNFYLLAKN